MTVTLSNTCSLSLPARLGGELGDLPAQQLNHPCPGKSPGGGSPRQGTLNRTPLLSPGMQGRRVCPQRCYPPSPLATKSPLLALRLLAA